MKERPILFSAPMVRAILDDRKTQTRRRNGLEKINAEPDAWRYLHWVERHPEAGEFVFVRRDQPAVALTCPYGKPGDRLWVREAFYADKKHDAKSPKQLVETDEVIWYAADHRPSRESLLTGYVPGKGRPSIHLPCELSRITLEVAGVRVERIQDISEEDAMAEGVDPVLYHHELMGVRRRLVSLTTKYVEGFRGIWISINGAESWDRNDWVWVVEFRRIES